jgi:hypothetical protein
MQTRKRSFVEALTNTLSGFLISWAVMDWIITPIFHTETTGHQNFWITCIFTVTSLGRTYLIRRFFHRGDK